MDNNENKKMFVASLNLPVETISTLVDIDDPGVEISMEDVVKKIKSKNVNSIKTMSTTINASSPDSKKPATMQHNVSYINKIDKKAFPKTSDVKFFKAVIEFATGIQKTFIVPSYVRFYSFYREMFIPIEFIRNRDILIDYTGKMVKIADAEEVTDFVPTEYYSISTMYEVIDMQETSDDESKKVKSYENYNFYINGVLAYISFKNLQKDSQD